MLQVKEIAINLGISSDKEVKTMLEFYHDLGVVVYFGGSGTMDNLLRNTVMLQPQWLIEKFSRILKAKQVDDKVHCYLICRYDLLFLTCKLKSLVQ